LQVSPPSSSKSERVSMKVLILGHENCGIIDSLAKGLRDIGSYDVTTAIMRRDPFFTKNKYDYILAEPQWNGGNRIQRAIYLANKTISKLRRKFFEKYHYSKYDVYLFMWSTLRDDLKDLEQIKRKGKISGFLFIGSDVRWIEAFKQQFKGNPYKGQLFENWIEKFRLLRTAELNCTSIFSVPDQSSLFIRGYFHLFLPVNISQIKYTPQERSKPIIIHAPSKRDIKGTAIVLEVIETLKAEGIAFDFELIENADNQFVLRKLENADILVDQLFLHGPATLACEAMAAGCAVATRFFHEEGLTSHAPICYVDETNLYGNLKKLILDINYRKSLIKRSRSFVEEHHLPIKVAQKIMSSFEKEVKNQYDYNPSFFRTHFQLPEGYSYPAEIEELNKKTLEKYN
jgi:hypothetical protein